MGDSMKTNITMQDILALIVSIGVFSLVWMKITVPDQVWSGWIMVITFFFTQDKSKQNTGVTNEKIPTAINSSPTP